MAETGEWWKNAVIYGVDVERFCDGNGDGIGDFTGLTDKLDHLARLGVPASGCCPSIPRPTATTAMTSPITCRSIRDTAPSTTSWPL